MKLDSGSRAFLSVVYNDTVNEDGRARTTEIRRETGLTVDQMEYRYEKLPAKGLITVNKENESRGGGSPQRIAVLTGKGRTLIEKRDINLETEPDHGAVDDEVSVSRSEIQKQREELSKLVERMNSLSQTVRYLEAEFEDGSGKQIEIESGSTLSASETDIVALRRRLDRIEDDVATIIERVDACASALRVDELEENVQELQSYVDAIGPWTGLTEMYLRALDETFQSEFDIDIGQKSTDMFREDILHRDFDELSPSLLPLVEQERGHRSGTD